jgi:hypothetical protein
VIAVILSHAEEAAGSGLNSSVTPLGKIFTNVVFMVYIDSNVSGKKP